MSKVQIYLSADHCRPFTTRCWAGFYWHWSKHWCVHPCNCKGRQKGRIARCAEISLAAKHSGHKHQKLIQMKSFFFSGSCCWAKYWQCTENFHSSPTEQFDQTYHYSLQWGVKWKKKHQTFCEKQTTFSHFSITFCNSCIFTCSHPQVCCRETKEITTLVHTFWLSQ